MPPVVGLRIQYVPEFESRNRAKELLDMDDAALNGTIRQETLNLLSIQDLLTEVDGVSFADVMYYETQIVFREDYNAQLSRGADGSSKKGRGAVWGGLSIRQALGQAAGRPEVPTGDGASERAGDVPREQQATATATETDDISARGPPRNKEGVKERSARFDNEGNAAASISRDGGTTLRLDRNGQAPLTHWGREGGLTSIDPKQWGTAAAGHRRGFSGKKYTISNGVLTVSIPVPANKTLVAKLDNGDYQKRMDRVMDTIRGEVFEGYTSAGYMSDGEYISNDWETNPNGEGYSNQITAGRSNILGATRDLRARVEAVNRKFSKRYGWGGQEAPKQSVSRRTEPPSISRDGGTTLRLDREGRVPLTHWGREGGLTAIDPDQWGTAAAGQERSRVGNGFRPRVYFGLPGYHVEGTVKARSGNRYFTTIAPEEIALTSPVEMGASAPSP